MVGGLGVLHITSEFRFSSYLLPVLRLILLSDIPSVTNIFLRTFLSNYASQPLYPLPDDEILDSSKLKDFADDNFKFDENGRKLSKQVENTVGKGEIARYEQFLLFPVFSKGLFPRGVKRCYCVGMG